jgi:LysM repeat protein
MGSGTLARLDQTVRLHDFMSRKLIHLCLSFAVILLLTLFGNSVRATAQVGDPYSLIDAVNNLRAANGLPPYQIDNILMAIAQGHSDYQAAIGEVTHIGAGGSRPKDRATAAGYGGGATFFISENIAGGTDLSVDRVISMWLGDDPHIQTMLGASYRDIGAGVSVSNGFVYYTIDVAYVAGGGNYSLPATSQPGGPTAIPIYLVQTATPKPDGSVVHTVMSGQTLIGIAKAYGVLVVEIKDLNNLTSDTIYVGDKLLIHLANTPGPTSTTTATTTPTKVATPTRYPTRTPTPSPSPGITPMESLLASNAGQDGPQSGSDPVGSILVIAIIGLAAGGVILMVVGSVLKRSTKPQGG